MKRKIKSVVAMLLAVAMTVALLPQTNFAVKASAEDFPIEYTGTARVTTSVSGAASNKKNYLTIELDEADETNVLFTFSGIYGADADELMAGGVLGFQLDEDITGHFEYDADTDILSAVLDQELYNVTGVGVYTAPYTVTVEPQIIRNDDGTAEILFDVTPQVEGEEARARRLYSTANPTKKTGYVLEDYEVAAIISQLGGGEEPPTPGNKYDELNAALDVTGDLQYMSEPYMENGNYTGQGKIGFSIDGTAMVDLWLIFMTPLIPKEKAVVNYSVENGELKFDPNGCKVSAWAPAAPQMGTLDFDVLMLTEKDAAGNTIVKFGWGTPEAPNCPWVYTLTPANIAELDALVNHEHVYDEPIKHVDATCTQAGYDVYACSKCGKTENRTKEDEPALGHDHKVTKSVAATCTAAGYDIYTCSRCGDTYNEPTSPALGHEYDVTNSVAATCTAAGYDVYTCSRCGDTYNKTTSPALGHDHKVTKSVAATCTAAGYDVYTCSRCENTYNKTTAKALGHSYKITETKASTYTVKGYKVYTCSHCNHSYRETIALKKVGSTKITSVSKKKKSAKKVKFSLKKISGAKYEIQISKAKKFSKKNILVKKTVKKAKVTISNKKLKNKSKLYVRARAVISGKAGAWTKAKNIKITK